ncbi:MAG: hypothetical protein H0X72_02750 [Acidobacteria bacterium]|jgi:hypothetical protein|nr:hypothetical protein [Acidobacteriota bacterium]
MSRVKIQIFHENGSAAKTERKLVRTVWVERDSDKKMTGKQAKQILAREFPELIQVYGILLTKGEEGWWTTRTIKPKDKCEYHYIWEKTVITEEDSE